MGIIRFGVWGWRARVGEGFDVEHVVRIARALGETWSWRFPGATILVGFDTRRDSERMALLCGEVLSACGLVAVVAERPCTLPALGWHAAHDASCKGAVMLTASSASCGHNGIIARGADGGPVSEAFAEAVERQIAGRPHPDRGSVTRADLVGAYCDAVVRRVEGLFPSLQTPRIVVDPLYGATVSCASEIFTALGCEVIGLHNEAVSDFRGLHPKACEPWVDECERTVRDTHAQLGIVFDGDGDRMGIIDERGRLVSSHDLAPLVLEHLIRSDETNRRVVATFATSLRLERQALWLDCSYTRVPGGFENVYREFGEDDVLMGADEKGGVADPAHLAERDGVYAACLALSAVLRNEQVPASSMIKEMEEGLGHTDWGTRTVPLDPASLQRLRNILPGMNPFEVAGRQPLQLSHAGGLRLTFDDDSWLMLRTATTRNAVHVTAEALDKKTLTELLQAGVAMVKQDI